MTKKLQCGSQCLSAIENNGFLHHILHYSVSLYIFLKRNQNRNRNRPLADSIIQIIFGQAYFIVHMSLIPSLACSVVVPSSSPFQHTSTHSHSLYLFASHRFVITPLIVVNNYKSQLHHIYHVIFVRALNILLKYQWSSGDILHIPPVRKTEHKIKCSEVKLGTQIWNKYTLFYTLF